MSSHHNARLLVRFYPPNFGKPVDVHLELEDFVARCYEPLPRDRELYDEPIISAAFTAREREHCTNQVADRAKLTNYLGPKIIHALTEAITKRDPINGYDPDLGY